MRANCAPWFMGVRAMLTRIKVGNRRVTVESGQDGKWWWSCEDGNTRHGSDEGYDLLARCIQDAEDRLGKPLTVCWHTRRDDRGA